MEWLLYLFPLLTVFPIVSGMMGWMKKEEKSKCVRVHKAVGIFGLCGTFFLSLIMLSAILTKNSYLLWGLVPLTAAAVSLILMRRNIRIEYNIAFFTTTNTLGLTKTYSYSDIQAAHWGKLSVTLYLTNKTIHLDQSYIGQKEFFRTVRRIRPNLPEKTNWCHRLFHNNVEEPEGKVFILLVGSVLALAMNILILAAYLPLVSAEQLKEIEFTYTESERQGGSLHLFSKGYNCRFFLAHYNQLVNSNNLLPQMETASVVQVKIKKEEEKHLQNQSKTVAIYEIQTDGTTILSMEECKQKDLQAFSMAIGLFGTLLILWIGIVICTIYFARHAEKYAKWLKWFIKPCHIKIGMPESKK